MNNASPKVFVVFNPKAGKEDQVDTIRTALAQAFPSPQWSCEIYETTGKEDVAAICRAACARGVSLVLAAGGDGTVVGVGNGLVHSQIPLGILPLGTGNDLARVLSIPLKLEDALSLIAGDHTTIEVDALQVGDHYYFSNVSVGISPQIMNETESDQKKRFGRLAYLWTMIRRSSIFHLHPYHVTIDGRSYRIRAAEVMVSNTTLLETLPHLFGPCETLQDNQLEVYSVSAEKLRDYVQLAWNVLRHPGQSSAKFHHLIGKQSVRIEAVHSPRLVQADGEVIGKTPVEVKIAPKALRVIMPKPAPEAKADRAEPLTAQVQTG